MWKGNIPPNLLEREILEELKKDLEQPEITLLLGARQVGKTSLMFLLLDFLSSKIPAHQIFYFDLENIIEAERLNRIKNFEKFVQLLKDEGADFSKRIYVFIDEIQYLDYPSSFLKYLYDHYKTQIKFVVSGSSSLEIKKKFTDRLTGRVHLFLIQGLTFWEYLYFLGEKNLAQKKKEVNLFRILNEKKFSVPEWFENLSSPFSEQFERFVVFGGYPGVIIKESSQWARDLMGIYSLYVRRDIKDLAEIEDIRGFNNLVGLLAWQIGNLISESELSRSSGLSRPTLKKYLSLLENTFVLTLLRPFCLNPRLEYSKMPKIYFLDTGLRNATINDFKEVSQRGDKGQLIENAVFSQLNKIKPEFSEIHFWRTQTKTEVDFVIKSQELLPIEVKYQFFKKPLLTSGLKRFLKEYQPQKAVIVNKNLWTKIKFQKTEVYFLPPWAL